MKTHAHGGTGWQDGLAIDLSASVNAYPLPDRIRAAAREAAAEMWKYPDPAYTKLREAVARAEGVPMERVVCGNGASELFTAIVRAFRPQRVALTEPCYSGYEYALGGCGTEALAVRRYPLREETGFTLGEDFLRFLEREEPELLFLADPNNPNGSLIPAALKENVIRYCREHGILLVLDECYLELTTRGVEALRGRQRDRGRAAAGPEAFGAAAEPGVLRVKAFTKTFAVPGARVGYLLAGTEELAERVRRELPEWNLSVFAEAVGIACARELLETSFAADALSYNADERERLAAALAELGFKVYPSDANFLLVRAPWPGLAGRLAAEAGILVRDCTNFHGLGADYFRFAVGSRQENEALLSALRTFTRQAEGGAR
ncbi:MAG: histidinol-phosphate aminotransferase family protein [Firmicutes bacterium]|nr:histidinol-phosphate aminotransferase family protein [Bacillota bacterium]